ncbi:MAG: QueT transporter family protein [Clostridia bacterium]
MKSTKFLVQAALIGAIYAVLTIAFAPFSYGIMQVRISEALTILPFFTPAAIPGLFVGCLLANIYGGMGLADIVFGSLATLIAASLSYLVRKYKWLVPFPPVIVNALIVGTFLYYIFMNDPEMSAPLLVIMGWVGLGQLIACYGLGYPLMLLLKKYEHIFK